MLLLNIVVINAGIFFSIFTTAVSVCCKDLQCLPSSHTALVLYVDTVRNHMHYFYPFLCIALYHISCHHSPNVALLQSKTETSSESDYLAFLESVLH